MVSNTNCRKASKTQSCMQFSSSLVYSWLNNYTHPTLAINTKHLVMRTVFVIVSLLFITSISAQHKTKNVILLSTDGYRWKELFGGADSALLFNKKYTSQDSSWLMQKYWAADATTRREKLMPFVWSEIAKHGQIYGNRDLGNLVNVKNKYWFSYPGRSETFTGYYDSLVNSNEYPDNPNVNV